LHNWYKSAERKISQKNPEYMLKAYSRSNWFFLLILKVANIRCFILIKCSEQEAWFKKYAIMCYNAKICLVKRIWMSVGKIAINTPNYKLVDFPKFAGHW
jgi:hypothetical protein